MYVEVFLVVTGHQVSMRVSHVRATFRAHTEQEETYFDLCPSALALRHYDVCGSGCTDPCVLDL
jgi:hypothetical protein